MFPTSNRPQLPLLSLFYLKKSIAKTVILTAAEREPSAVHKQSSKERFYLLSPYFWWINPRGGAGGSGQSTRDKLIFKSSYNCSKYSNSSRNGEKFPPPFITRCVKKEFQSIFPIPPDVVGAQSFPERYLVCILIPPSLFGTETCSWHYFLGTHSLNFLAYALIIHRKRLN